MNEAENPAATATSPRSMPSVFISHGAPTLAVEDGPAHRFLCGYGKRLGRPAAVLLVSAHFEAPVATVCAGEHPATIHDFSGFPQSLYDIEYPAPGDPPLAGRVAAMLSAAGIAARESTGRGFDHGAWVPLRLMYPSADVPLVQLSLDPAQGTDYHFRLGRLLRPLREDGVMIVGSGGAVHNLGQLDWGSPAGEPPGWARDFNDWLLDAVENGRTDDVLAYRQRAPRAVRNHPTEEHFLPLIFALGAAGDDERGVRVHASWTFGALSMDNYQFGGPLPQT